MIVTSHDDNHNHIHVSRESLSLLTFCRYTIQTAFCYTHSDPDSEKEDTGTRASNFSGRARPAVLVLVLGRSWSHARSPASRPPPPYPSENHISIDITLSTLDDLDLRFSSRTAAGRELSLPSSPPGTTSLAGTARPATGAREEAPGRRSGSSSTTGEHYTNVHIKLCSSWRLDADC